MRYILWTEGTSDFGLRRVLNWLLRQNHVYGDHDAHAITKQNYASLEDVALDETILVSPAGETAMLLFIHVDADSDEEKDGKGPQARRDLISQWIDQARERGVVLPQEVPIVPVHTTEAWLLACEQTLRSWAGIKPNQSLPTLPYNVEIQTRPKDKLKQVLEELQGKHLSWGEFATARQRLWEEMERIHGGFTPLERIPAFKQLATDTKEAIQRHGLTQH